MPQRFISWAFKKTEVPDYIISLAVPTVVETTMETLSLLLIYVSNQGELDLILKIF